ncbi:MAG: phage major capsid protein [Acidobacteria bacterium]|nr:phage major capsid protein [Acidobacteriota bacterium]
MTLLQKQIEAIGSAALRGDRAMRADEKKELLALTERRDRLRDDKAEHDRTLAALEAHADAERVWCESVPPDPDTECVRQAEARAGLRRLDPAFDARGRSRIARPTGRRFVELFGGQVALSRDGWTSPDEFLATLHAGLADPRLRPASVPGVHATATGRVGADGGFSVPTEFVAQWLDASLESEIVRPRATVWPMTSATRKVPGWDVSDSSSTLFGAFTGQWVNEGAEITEQTPELMSLTLTACKLALVTQLSNELVADGLGYDEQLSRAIVKAAAWYLDLAFLRGTGAGQPLGVLNAPCLITVAAEGGQVASTIVYENLTKMFARQANKQNSIWVANSTAIPQLAALSIAIGTGGSHIPVLTGRDGSFEILTRPVVFTEKVPALGSVGDIGLYDFSQYAIGLRQDMSLDRSAHAGFTRDTSYYRGLLRADGQPTWESAYTPYAGDALSPFVTVAAR